MDGFEFENCGNAMLKCEGKILGGVEKATCTRKNSFTEIKEFFNDKPVERIVSNEWELTFVMKITDKTPFLERDSFKSLELDLAKKKIIYTDCKVLEFSSVTQGSGSILATVKIKCRREENYMNDKNSDELYRLAESENGGKDTEMFGEFLERESRRYSRRLDEEEEAKSL